MMHAREVTPATGPQPLVDIINAIVTPAEQACYAAFGRFGEWRKRDNERRRQKCSESEEHLAEGVRVMAAVREAFAEVQRKLHQGEELAGVMVTMLEAQGDTLVAMGADASAVTRDKEQVAARRQQLLVIMKALAPLEESVQALSTATSELMFAFAEQQAYAAGRQTSTH